MRSIRFGGAAAAILLPACLLRGGALTTAGQEAPQVRAERWKEVAVLEERTANSLGFTPDGKALVQARFDGGIAHVDLATKKRRILAPGTPGITYGRFRFWTLSADGTTVVAVDAPQGGGAGRLVFWDAVTGKEKPALDLPDSVGMMCGAVRPDGGMVAFGYRESIELWDVKARRSYTVTAHEGLVRSLDFTEDGKVLLSASHDKTVKLWDVATRKLIRTLRTPEKAYLVKAAPGGKSLAAATMNGDGVDCDHALHVWEVATGQERTTLFKGRKYLLTSMTFFPGGRKLATSMYYRRQPDPRFAPVGKRVNPGLSQGARIWDLATGKETSALNPGEDRLGNGRPVFSPDGRRLLLSVANTVTVWERE